MILGCFCYWSWFGCQEVHVWIDSAVKCTCGAQGTATMKRYISNILFALFLLAIAIAAVVIGSPLSK